MSQNNQYAYATWVQAQNALSLRLNDTSQVHWTKAEVSLYLAEALREWNCLTQCWIQDWATTFTSSSLPWQSTGNSLNSLVGSNLTSPRYQTLNDAYCYTLAEYHLLEPPTGA